MATPEAVDELRRALVATQDRVITLETTAREQLARLEQQAATAVETQSKLQFLEDEREKLVAITSRMGNKGGSIMDSKGLMKPSQFNDDRTKWRAWLSKLVNWMSGWHEGIRSIVRWVVRNQPDGIDIDPTEFATMMAAT